MKKLSILLVILTTLFLSTFDGHSQIGNAGPGQWSLKGTNPIQLYFGDKLVTVYNPGKAEGKPFFYPVIGPTGENMTRHWPMKEGDDTEETDHIHHRGMWYGLGNVNGLDFWHYPGDEKKKDKTFGKIVHKSMNGFSSKEGGSKVSFKVKSDWLGDAPPSAKVMSDSREFTLFYTKEGSLVVDAKITLIADSGDVTINDDKEGAWSIRTIPTLRLEGKAAKGSMVNSEGQTGKEVWGKRAAWVDYYGTDKAGKEVGIAIFDHPSNPRHKTWWHARHYGLFTANPFGQGHFEKGAAKDAGKFVIENGKSVTFTYRTIFHKGNAEAAGLAAAYKAFSDGK